MNPSQPGAERRRRNCLAANIWCVKFLREGKCNLGRSVGDGMEADDSVEYKKTLCVRGHHGHGNRWLTIYSSQTLVGE